MAETRWANVNWDVQTPQGTVNWEGLHAAVLMDIRDELQKLNRLLSCQNFREVPEVLRGIKRNTAKPRKAKSK